MTEAEEVLLRAMCLYSPGSYERRILLIRLSCQVRIQDLVKGAQLLRPEIADVAEWSHLSEAIYLWLGPRAPLRALEALGFLMPKYSFSHILETLSVISVIYFNTKSKDFYFQLH